MPLWTQFCSKAHGAPACHVWLVPKSSQVAYQNTCKSIPIRIHILNKLIIAAVNPIIITREGRSAMLIGSSDPETPMPISSNSRLSGVEGGCEDLCCFADQRRSGHACTESGLGSAGERLSSEDLLHSSCRHCHCVCSIETLRKV